MGVLLHANYCLWGANGQKIVVPAPIDKNTPHVPWWWDHLAGQAADFKRCGFSAALLPPVCKSASGAAPDADGYGLNDNYDIGSKDQVYNRPTRSCINTTAATTARIATSARTAKRSMAASPNIHRVSSVRRRLADAHS
jgi:hypothetical protein